jgi:hypothetical protein
MVDKTLESALAAKDEEIARLKSEMADLKVKLRDLMAGMT